MRLLQILYHSIVGLIISVGIFCRSFFYYSYHRDLWADEMRLAHNLFEKGYWGLFSNLIEDQAAPPFFLMVSKSILNLGLDLELSLRFLPFVCAILSVFLFYKLAEKVLTSKIAVLAALILFCLNYRLIYFAQEFKQYALDVFFFIGILLASFYINLQKDSARKLILWGIGLGICMYFSYPACIAIAVLEICLIFDNILKNKEKYRGGVVAKQICCLFVPVVILFIPLFVSQYYLNESSFLKQFWHAGFLNTDLSNLMLMVKSFFLEFFFYENHLFFVYAFLFGLLCSLLLKKWILLLPILIALVLSYLELYPLERRVSLYLLPISILIITSSIEFFFLYIRKILPVYRHFLFVLFTIIIALFFVYKLPIQQIKGMFFYQLHFNQSSYLLDLAYQKMNSDDVLYLLDDGELKFYLKHKSYIFDNIVLETHVYTVEDFANRLKKLEKGKRYFLLFPMDSERDKKKYALSYLSQFSEFEVHYAPKNKNCMLIIWYQE